MKRYILIISAMLYVFALKAQSMTYTCRYWFDQNHEQVVITTFNDSIWQAELDVGELADGLHTLYIHVMDTSMKWSAPKSYLFFKMDETFPEDYQYHCWFDQDFDNQQNGIIGNGSFLLDVANLEEGLHTVNVIVEGHALTSTKCYLFFKMPVEDPTVEQQYICWFDNDYSTMQTGPLGSGSFLLDVDEMSSGLHVVNVQLKKGTTITSSKCNFFIKTEGIVKWEYYINGDWENRITTEVEITDTLDVVGLLPVETQPIRSTCFQFHPNGDNPEIFAKNEITFRFWDSGKYFKDETKFYVDENAVEVIQANILERNSIETISAPRDNQITWFKMDAGIGDSLVFVADKACTMQLFAPSGEEVYSATASEAIVFGGCHAWEEGTYYLAVHDVMGSGETVSVTYQHFDKYVVLVYSPDKVGNRVGNRFMVDLIGNGFNYLENAMFIRENDTIVLNQVIVSSRTKPRLQFLISDNIANGKYDFHLMFRDGEETETLSYVEALELEEPNSGEKLITITTPAQTANPYPVRITVENTGNMDYVYVPFNIAFTWPTNLSSDQNRIDRIDFADFSATMTYEADSLGYSFAHVTTNLLGMQKEGGIMFFGIPYLKAHETKTFTLNFTAPAHVRFDLYAWTGEGYEYNINFDTLVVDYSDRATPEAQNLIDFGDNAQEVGGHLGNPADAAGRVANNAIKTGLALAGIQNGLGHVQDKAACDNYGITPDDPLYDEIMGLHPPIATPGEIMGGPLGNLLDRLMGNQRSTGDNPNPDPGTPCSVFLCHPGDPNELYGYTSESGSHYMRQEIQNIQYEIEFENDTTLATAAAHTIIVRDTLDASKFDLNSLAARSVTIGDKRLELNGEQNFARTLDMRPELYVIAQVNQDYDPATGIIEWAIQSLDPMTMEPTDDPNQGVLPVNYYGDGVGFIDYSVDLKQAFDDGTEINNRAGIIFDQEDIIMTPTWTNIVDAVKPISHIENVVVENDSLNFSFVSSDNRSGVWYHTLYYRNDSTDMEWQVKKAQIFESSYKLHFDEYQTTEYFVITVDSAGNVEAMKTEAEVVVESSNSVFPFFVAGYGESANAGWKFIASPIAGSIAATTVGNIFSATQYDLYDFDQGEESEWRNYKSNSFNLTNGQGYLYATKEDKTLVFRGTYNEADAFEMSLVYTGANPHTDMRGWNLIGNPFTVPAYIDRSYYTMNEEGTAIEPVAVSEGSPIPACHGVMVKAEASDETVTFSRTAQQNAPSQGNIQIIVAQATTRGNTKHDKAIVSFSPSDQLGKFNFNESNAKVYISQDGKDYAIAYAAKTGELPVSFKAAKNGTYTINVDTDGMEFYYLHLIDNLTGNDVDLLALRQAQGPMGYTFEARTTDYASRFILRFIPKDDASTNSASDNFAYCFNGTWIIANEGDATLQVVDIMGRVLSSERISGCCEKHIQAAAGVYVLHLMDGNNVRTQKIVVP